MGEQTKVKWSAILVTTKCLRKKEKKRKKETKQKIIYKEQRTMMCEVALSFSNLNYTMLTISKLWFNSLKIYAQSVKKKNWKEVSEEALQKHASSAIQGTHQQRFNGPRSGTIGNGEHQSRDRANTSASRTDPKQSSTHREVVLPCWRYWMDRCQVGVPDTCITFHRKVGMTGWPIWSKEQNISKKIHYEMALRHWVAENRL